MPFLQICDPSGEKEKIFNLSVTAQEYHEVVTNGNLILATRILEREKQRRDQIIAYDVQQTYIDPGDQVSDEDIKNVSGPSGLGHHQGTSSQSPIEVSCDSEMERHILTEISSNSETKWNEAMTFKLIDLVKENDEQFQKTMKQNMEKNLL